LGSKPTTFARLISKPYLVKPGSRRALVNTKMILICLSEHVTQTNGGLSESKEVTTG
jgi:hypothetical protein